MNEKPIDQRSSIVRFAYLDESFRQRASAYGPLLDRVQVSTERACAGKDLLPTVDQRCQPRALAKNSSVDVGYFFCSDIDTAESGDASVSWTSFGRLVDGVNEGILPESEVTLSNERK